MTYSTIDQEARNVIYGDREQTYGHPSKNLQLIAEFWTSYLRGKEVLTCDDVCNMMILMKTARLKNMPDHRDSLVDTIGYTLLKERCRETGDLVNEAIEELATRQSTELFNQIDESELGKISKTFTDPQELIKELNKP